jgi:hypothetical protein
MRVIQAFDSVKGIKVMPTTIVFDEIPTGYAETSARRGETVNISQFGFYSSEDGDNLITRLEGLPQRIISSIPSTSPILPSTIDTLLAIFKRDKTAKVYLNEIQLIGQVRVKKDVQKGDKLTTDHILDFSKMKIPDIEIPRDAGLVFVFSVGWRKGFLYDLGPLHGDLSKKRDYDFEELLGSLYSYLIFQERYKIDEKIWVIIFDQKWFPFNHLDNELIQEMILHAREGWDLDDLLPKFSDNVQRLLKHNSLIKQGKSYFNEHMEIFEKGFERYISEDYISCTSILYPRIEGLLRTFYRTGGYKGKPGAKNLSTAAITHYEKSRITQSLLLPTKFHDYLDKIYFANFAPGAKPDVGRHSVAHGEARAEDFNLKAATLAILTIYQLSLFMSDGQQSKINVEQKT